jgi:hypothetical protein
MVKIMSLPKLSPFVSYMNNQSELGFGCSYILMRYPNFNKKCSNYMYSEDIPALFSYLMNHGYTINNSVTKMMNGSRIFVGNGYGSTSDKRLICFVSFTS